MQSRATDQGQTDVRVTLGCRDLSTPSLPRAGLPFLGSRQPLLLPRHGVTLTLALLVTPTSLPSLALALWAGGGR